MTHRRLVALARRSRSVRAWLQENITTFLHGVGEDDSEDLLSATVHWEGGIFPRLLRGWALLTDLPHSTPKKQLVAELPTCCQSVHRLESFLDGQGQQRTCRATAGS